MLRLLVAAGLATLALNEGLFGVLSLLLAFVAELIQVDLLALLPSVFVGLEPASWLERSAV